MIRLSTASLAATLALVPLSARAAGDPGMMTRAIAVAHQGPALNMSILFPATGGTDKLVGDNPVFFGTRVRAGASPQPGRHPLVLMSHGWGGNYVRMTWLGAGLAARGAIIVAVNHPASTTGDIRHQAALDHGTRARDLSAALDHVLADPVLSAAIDPTRIHALGFSFGGWTALSLGGVRARRDGFEAYCDRTSGEPGFCRELKVNGAAIASLDRARFEASYRDSRIASVAAIDPGLTWGLTAADVADLQVPVLLIGLGSGKDRLDGTDTSAAGSNFEALVPKAEVERIAPAQHFTALGLCKPAGEALLQGDGDDPVCTDPAGTDRKAVLDRIVDRVARHFRLP